MDWINGLTEEELEAKAEEEDNDEVSYNDDFESGWSGVNDGHSDEEDLYNF